MLYNVGAHDNRPFKGFAVHKMRAVLLQVPVQPAAERVPRAAFLEIGPVVDAYDLEFGGQGPQFAASAAADVDDGVAAEAACQERRERVNLRLVDHALLPAGGIREIQRGLAADIPFFRAETRGQSARRRDTRQGQRFRPRRRGYGGGLARRAAF